MTELPSSLSFLSPSLHPDTQNEAMLATFFVSGFCLSIQTWKTWPFQPRFFVFQHCFLLTTCHNPDTKNAAELAVFFMSGFFTTHSEHKKCHWNGCVFRASLFFSPPPGLPQIWTQKLQPNWVQFSCLDFLIPLPCTCLLVTRLNSSCFTWYNELFGEFSNMTWNDWRWLKTTEIALISLDSVPN